MKNLALYLAVSFFACIIAVHRGFKEGELKELFTRVKEGERFVSIDGDLTITPRTWIPVKDYQFLTWSISS